MIKYNILRIIFTLIMKTLFKFEVQGTKNVPSKGPYILAVNHLTIVEPPALLAVMPIKRITVFIAEKWRDVPVIGWLIVQFEGIVVDRDNIDRQALKAALTALRNGGVLGIAPEGTRSKTGGLIRAKSGIAFIATRAKVPILPVGISGQIGFEAKLKRLQRPHIRVNIGELVHLPDLKQENSSNQPKIDRGERLQQLADEVMIAIARLIDPEIRGVYADAVDQATKTGKVETSNIAAIDA